jgi:hypothetical protein
MKHTFLIIFTLSILTLTSCQNKNSLNGKVFIGFEEVILFDAPRQVFQTTLNFKNDSVTVERNLISINGKDTLHLKKMGYLYRYKGLVKKNDAKIKFLAFAYKCNDCDMLAEIGQNGEIKTVLDQTEYDGHITKSGIKLNGINFTEK